ncbi:MAG: DUF3313 domain-containing protein [Deltaproteobacteria bacterium]|nr:DUF3313 domain-containing protein [Deltaproteobacteria bacterium]
MKKAWWLFMVLLGVLGCAGTERLQTTAPPPPEAGFLAGYYSQMVPGPPGGVKLRWFRPGVDFTKYHKVMLDSVIFFFADDSEYKGMDPQALKELADGFHREIINTLRGTCSIVTKPGPGVVRIRFAITDLKQSRPVVSAITTLVPAGLGISVIKRGVTGSWSGSGATAMEVMALDSLTQEVIAVAKDHHEAAFDERFTKWGSAEEAFRFWAGRLKLFVEKVKRSKEAA